MKELTPTLIKELKSFLVERVVDNMSTEDLVQYVTDDLDDMYKNMADEEFLNDAKNYWDDMFDEVVEEIKEFEQCDFKKTLADKKDDYLDSLSEGKDKFIDEVAKGIVEDDMSGVLDDYGSKVDALVKSMSVTDEEVSTTHRRRDLDSL